MVLYYWNISCKKCLLFLSLKFFQETENNVVMVQHSKIHSEKCPLAFLCTFLESFKAVQKTSIKTLFKGALEEPSKASSKQSEMLKELFEKVFRQMIHGVHKLYWNSLLATAAAAS